MASVLPGDLSHNGMVKSTPYTVSHDKHEEVRQPGWYFSRKEIEECSPSRRDGIDLKKETYLRKSYCTFLQDLGMRLKVPQVTIATAIVFCHRFFLRQSHAKNDRRTIATVCMFLAGKVEETPRPLKDVIMVSYEIIHKKDPAAIQRIKQREVYEQQKELILIGERLVLTTLGFDLNMHHPYKPLVEAIKKFKVAQNALAQVAWNFVNDGLRTSLCLQFMPHHIAAGAIFLAAKFLKVKLPSDGEKVWWQEFDVTPRQLEEVSNQMLELYEQNRGMPLSHGNETEGSSAVGTNNRAPTNATDDVEEPVTHNRSSQMSKAAPIQSTVPSSSSICSVDDQSHAEKQNEAHDSLHTEGDDHVKYEPSTDVSSSKVGIMEPLHRESLYNLEIIDSRTSYGSEHPVKEPSAPVADGKAETREKKSVSNEGNKDYFPMMDAINKIDKDKVKAALEKRRKARGGATRKVDLIDEDDIIERELEHGVELAAEDERNKQERSRSWSKPSYNQEPQNVDWVIKNGYHGSEKATDNAEDGELSIDSQEIPSLKYDSKKRKAASPGNHYSGHDWHDIPPYQSTSTKHRECPNHLHNTERFECAERDHKRPRQGNQV